MNQTEGINPPVGLKFSEYKNPGQLLLLQPVDIQRTSRQVNNVDCGNSRYYWVNFMNEFSSGTTRDYGISRYTESTLHTVTYQEVHQ